ncbi:MAG: thiamine phosphate synthase [Tannerella sp.]|jgi:thiamine-phosphate pyrophosphorylase|nr:thiamine phosphate synthase [Tannerella sp.]
MKLICITSETVFGEEATVLNALFEAGMPTLHLRKPSATKDALKDLLSRVKDEYHSRIVLHDYFDLVQCFPLKGVHLNGRNPVCPQQKVSSVSQSCHSLESVRTSAKELNYVFLSPVFDSISKSGYHHAFTDRELQRGKEEGTIHAKVVALGGISPETVPLAAQYGFGGVAVLGALWGNFLTDRDETALLKRFHNLLSITKKQ